jgi:hypothetical protein
MQNRTKDLVCFDWHRPGPTEQGLEITLHETTRPLIPWREELTLAAQYIAAKNSNLVLALSGGIDSEAMARVFMEADIPFQAVTWRYNTYANIHDIKFAQTFCKTHNIELTIIDVDLNQFQLNDIPRYKTLGYEFTHPAHAIRLLMINWAEENNSTLVAGGGEQLFHEYNNLPHIGYNRDQPAFYDYIENHTSNTHFPLFFQQNIHILRAYQEIDLVKLLLTSPKRYFQNTEINSSIDKMFVYHAEWPQMQRRPKYHGFEKSMINPPYTQYQKVEVPVGEAQLARSA